MEAGWMFEDFPVRLLVSIKLGVLHGSHSLASVGAHVRVVLSRVVGVDLQNGSWKLHEFWLKFLVVLVSVGRVDFEGEHLSQTDRNSESDVVFITDQYMARKTHTGCVLSTGFRE
jgi:hypothetical protein